MLLVPEPVEVGAVREIMIIIMSTIHQKLVKSQLLLPAGMAVKTGVPVGARKVK